MSDKKEAVFKVHIRGAIEDVWHEITKTDAAQGRFTPRKDFPFEVIGKKQLLSGFWCLRTAGQTIPYLCGSGSVHKSGSDPAVLL